MYKNSHLEATFNGVVDTNYNELLEWSQQYFYIPIYFQMLVMNFKKKTGFY